MREFADGLTSLLDSNRALNSENIKLRRERDHWRDEYLRAKGEKTHAEMNLDGEIQLLREQG